MNYYIPCFCLIIKANNIKKQMSVVAGFHFQNIDVVTEITYFVHAYTVRSTFLRLYQDITVERRTLKKPTPSCRSNSSICDSPPPPRQSQVTSRNSTCRKETRKANIVKL
jgi:hypothetical protein